MPYEVQYSATGRERDYCLVGYPHDTVEEALFWLRVGTKTLKRGIARVVDDDGEWIEKIYGQADTE